MMKLRCLAVLSLALLPLALSAQSSPVGEWKAVFTGPLGDRPMMVAEITFSIRSTPSGLAGVAQAGNWPGALELSDVKVDGDRLSFTATGKEGWSTSPGGVRQDRCCPKLMFSGTTSGDQMKLMLTWQATDRPDDPNARRLPMEAKRASR